jgi:type I restriction enzyme S subunit
LIPGFAFKSVDFQSSGAPVIKIKNVKANRVVLDNLAYVDPSFLATKQRYVVQSEDLLITMSGNRHDGTPETWVGKIAQFRDKRPFLVNQRVGILRPKPHVAVDRRYCAYVLSSWSYQELFIAIATSSGGQANLSPSQIFAADLVCTGQTGLRVWPVKRY